MAIASVKGLGELDCVVEGVWRVEVGRRTVMIQNCKASLVFEQIIESRNVITFCYYCCRLDVDLCYLEGR
jgi:hypothetical protein